LKPKVRSTLIERWVKAKLVSVTTKSNYRRIKAADAGKPINPFGKMGCDPYIPDSILNGVTADLNSRHGKRFALATIKSTLKAAKEKQIRDANPVPLHYRLQLQGKICS
jgi:hypothetical protein